MTYTVHCQKYKQELEGLSRAPFPGEQGETIYQTISKQAWQEWMQLQTMLINEKHLALLEPETQTYLAEQRAKFFNNQDFEQPSGYKAPETPKS